MQNYRNRESSQRVRLETSSVHAIRGDSPLLYPEKNSVVNGQLKRGLFSVACLRDDERGETFFAFKVRSGGG